MDLKNGWVLLNRIRKKIVFLLETFSILMNVFQLFERNFLFNDFIIFDRWAFKTFKKNPPNISSMHSNYPLASTWSIHLKVICVDKLLQGFMKEYIIILSPAFGVGWLSTHIAINSSMLCFNGFGYGLSMSIYVINSFWDTIALFFP